MLRIRIQPHGALITAPAGARLVDVIDDLRGVGLPLSCRGGRCGTCKVRLAAGAEQFEPPTPREQESLRFSYAAADERFGCQLIVRADAAGEAELELSGQAGA